MDPVTRLTLVRAAIFKRAHRVGPTISRLIGALENAPPAALDLQVASPLDHNTPATKVDTSSRYDCKRLRFKPRDQVRTAWCKDRYSSYGTVSNESFSIV